MTNMANGEITTILFDLDGTLLLLDEDKFVEAFGNAFFERCDKLSVDRTTAIKALAKGFDAMMHNDGSQTNEKRFWEVFSATLQMPINEAVSSFLPFYTDEFTQIRSLVRATELPKKIVETVHGKGYRLVLATNPLFPRAATLERIRWAKINPSYFTLITTYEDFSYAKPSLEYYTQILEKIGKRAEQCLMIGNNEVEDMAAASLGMEIFLVTQSSASSFRSGTLEDLLSFCEQLGPCPSPLP